MRLHSLSARLVATTLALLALALLVAGVVSTLTLHRYLQGKLDDDVRNTSDAFVRFESSQLGLPPPGNGGGRGGSGGGPRPTDALLVSVDADGRVTKAILFSREGGEIPASEYPDLIAVAPGARPVSADLGSLGPYLLYGATLPNGGRQVTGLPEGPAVVDPVANLLTTELIVSALTLLGAGLAGMVLVRRELRPLERVAVTATRVSNLQLDRGEVELAERVPDADPRTEVGQVGAALNRMLDHVGSALEARQDSETQLRQFIADASHELRTPLAAIRGYAELTRRTKLPEETTYSLVRISSQAERMTTLVEDLLLLARLDAGRPLERGEVDLTRLVLDGVSDAHAAGPDHRWLLTLPDEPVTVPGDASRLAQVLSNLLANARTHTPTGTSVTVALASVGERARISVVDDGPGIPPELLPHVFERFARGSTSRSRENGSTGLGLAIVDAVVAAHGGSVQVTSQPGRTEFAVLLPMTATLTTPPPRRPARTH